MLIKLSKGARQPKRARWSLERLNHERAIALGYAIDPRSNLSYTSALNSYITFCNLHEFPVQPTESTMSYFIVYMCHHIRPQSVDSYLSGICNQLEPYFPNIREIRSSILVARTLKGCKRLKGTTVNRKLPISRDHIQLAIDQYGNSPIYDDKLWLCQFLCGFDALLRVAEFTMPDNVKARNWKKFSRCASVQWFKDDTAISFLLPAHKGDTIFEGNRIIIVTATVIRAFHAYVSARDSHFPLHPALWVRADGTVPTRDWFVKRLRQLIPDSHYGGQSLRAGGATALAENGTLPHIIQARGRWSSEAFRIYIRKNPVLLQAMIHRQPVPTLL